MDPIDDIFASLRVQGAIYTRLEATAPWGVDFACGHTARFGLVVRGTCVMTPPGGLPPRMLRSGDCFVLVRGESYTLRDALGSPMRPCTELIRHRAGRAVHVGGEGGVSATVLAGWFTFEEPGARPLVALMPPLLQARIATDRIAALQAALELLDMETALPALGSDLVVSRLADIVLVQAIRAHVAAGDTTSQDWFGALADRRIGPALRAVHRDIARPWTVEALADAAGQSRAAFAARFKQRVGQAPLEYLTRWRMLRAGRLLRRGEPLGQIAEQVGYESEAAFNKAFKRQIGVTPGAYRRQSTRPDASLDRAPPTPPSPSRGEGAGSKPTSLPP